MNDTVNAVANRRRPPSRVRYEATHPTVGVRLSQDMYGRAEELRTTGVSFAEVFRRGLDLWERDGVRDAELYDMGYAAGQADGVREARGRFRITFPCDLCSGEIEVEAGSPAAKEAVALLAARRWGHSACHERQHGRPDS